MNAPYSRRPWLRWVAPGAALATIVAGSQIAAHWPADAATDAPPRSAAQLLTDVQRAQAVPLSGTVTAKMSLGLPDLPAGSGNPTDPLSLLTGTHTAKVWYDGKQQARVAVLGQSAETDIVTNDKGLWVWQSADRSVLHVAGRPAAGGKSSGARPHVDDRARMPQALSTPEGVTAWALKMLDPTTSVTTTSNDRVAGRAAYELVLTPKTSNTKIGSIRIAIDADRHIPLRAQVFARGANKPAVNVGFSSIDFGKPSASRFDFTPPPGAKITTPKKTPGTTPKTMRHRSADKHSTTDLPHVVGKAWSSVLVGTVPAKSTAGNKDQSLTSALRMLPKASGSWGQGRLLDTALFSAVITDDGRFAVGAVQPATLYAALGR